MSLTVAQFRGFVTTSLGDDEVEKLLDAALEAIIEVDGPAIDGYVVTDVNELITARGDLLRLSRQASAVVEVIEGTTTLATDDYELRSSGMIVRRLHDGTNPRRRWWGRIDITYTPVSREAERDRVQLALVKLDIATNPGLVSQTIGAWSEQYASGNTWNYQLERQSILESLGAGAGGIW